MTLTQKLRTFKGTVALREWDHGSSIDFWLTPMTNDELEKWWSAQVTFEDNPPLANKALDQLAMIFNEKRPKQRVGVCKWPGTKISAESDEDRNVWLQFYESRAFCCCHVQSDEDSFMETPDGRRIHHQGRDESVLRMTD